MSNDIDRTIQFVNSEVKLMVFSLFNSVGRKVQELPVHQVCKSILNEVVKWQNLIIQLTICIASKINVTPKGVYLPISKLHFILTVANLLAHNNKVKFVTAVKFYYRVLQLLQFFWQSDTFRLNIYYARDHYRV